MIKYYKLFDLLNKRNMKKTDLLKIISSPTLAKLSKGETIKTDVINRICEFLQCQPGEIMEYIEKEELINPKTNKNDAYLIKRPYAEDAPDEEIKFKKNRWNNQ